METKKKITHLIFLDFDGVMTSVEGGTSFLCCNTKSYYMEEEIKHRFKILHDNFPDMKIVLSTAWCNHGALDDPTPNWPWKGHDMKTPLPALHKWLTEEGMFYGTISTEKKDKFGQHITKYEKIKKWLKEHEDELDYEARIVVLDDDASDYNQLRAIDSLLLKNGTIMFLQTNYEKGFTYDDMMKVLNYFDLD